MTPMLKELEAHAVVGSSTIVVALGFSSPDFVVPSSTLCDGVLLPPPSVVTFVAEDEAVFLDNLRDDLLLREDLMLDMVLYTRLSLSWR